MYRELQNPAKTLTYNQSHARAVGECPVSHVGILIVAASIVWLLLPPIAVIDESALAFQATTILLVAAYSNLWAIVHRRALEKKWLEEAMADEEAIETIERGGVPQGYQYDER